MPKYFNSRKAWQYSTKLKVRAVKMCYRPDIKSIQVAEGLGIHPLCYFAGAKSIVTVCFKAMVKSALVCHKKQKTATPKELTKTAKLKAEVERLKKEIDLLKIW